GAGVAPSRRNPRPEPGTPAPPAATGESDTGGTGAAAAGPPDGGPVSGGPRPRPGRRGGPPRPPPGPAALPGGLRGAARGGAGPAGGAPLLRAARLVACWAGAGQRPGTGAGLTAAGASAAIAELELTPAELDVAWRVAAGTGMVAIPGQRAAPGPRVDVLASGDAGDVLTMWEGALRGMLGADDLDGMATALYTVGGPVKMDALFEAYMAAAGSQGRPGRRARSGGEDLAAGLSSAPEPLADLGVVELGTDDAAGGLTVTLSRLGIWGMHRH